MASRQDIVLGAVLRRLLVSAVVAGRTVPWTSLPLRGVSHWVAVWIVVIQCSWLSQPVSLLS